MNLESRQQRGAFTGNNGASGRIKKVEHDYLERFQRVKYIVSVEAVRLMPICNPFALLFASAILLFEEGN